MKLSIRPFAEAVFVVLVQFVGLQSALARDAIAMRLTMYDDGRSCPANCDAHVVFHSDDNGTPNAHLPGSDGKCTPRTGMPYLP